MASEAETVLRTELRRAVPIARALTAEGLHIDFVIACATDYLVDMLRGKMPDMPRTCGPQGAALAHVLSDAALRLPAHRPKFGVADKESGEAQFLRNIVAETLRASAAAPEPAFRWRAGEAERISLFPIRHPDIWAYRKKLEALHWTAQEVNLEQDAVDWATKLTADERHFVKMQLAFFAGADIWVLDNLSDNFAREIDCMEARMVYAAQEDQECTHTEAYALQIQAVLHGAEREATLNAAASLPAVAAMRDWARAWLDRGIPIGERLVAWAIFEGVLFSASFASLQWLLGRNLLPGITAYNKFIARDEGVHTLHTCLYVREYLAQRPAAARVAEIFGGAIAVLDEFVETSLPVRLIGINADLMRDYVRFQADCVAAELGYAPLYGAANPFPFMDQHALNAVAKTNFFEHTSQAYSTPVDSAATRFGLYEEPED